METATGKRAATLARIAESLQGASAHRGVPALWFLTDEVRTPDPLAIARALPERAAIILRHYRAPGRAALARALAGIARERGLTLLIGADPALAEAIGAAGVHYPGWSSMDDIAPNPDHIVSASVHDDRDLQLRQTKAAILLVSPVFASASHAGAPALGRHRLAEFVLAAPRPIIALGGVTAANAPSLHGTGVAGIAAIGAFVGD